MRVRSPSHHYPLFALLTTVVVLLVGAGGALATPTFSTAPDVPNLPTLTLNGQAQTLHATMNNVSVALDVVGLTGFNVTVQGDATTGHSAVFKQYCPNPTCGSDSLGYVTAGATLPADSLTLNSTGASWTETSGSGGSTPTMLCNSGCAIDSPTAIKIASQTGGVSVVATWTTAGWSATSIALAVPTTVRAFSQPGEMYRVDLLWTVNAGP